MLLLLAAGFGAVGGAVALGRLPQGALAVATVVAGHGALLATALAWATRASGPAWTALALLAGAALAARLAPPAALAYLGPALWVALLAARGRLDALGLTPRVPGPALAAGIGIGVFLGGHLLVSASRTFGYRLRADPVEVAPWIAYDLGANVLAAECFFRGGLFDRAQRRGSFGAAVALSTAGCLVRYLLDPLLPRTAAIVIGMVFYLSLVSVANCWLLRWSGSLVPGMATALLFFAAYRLLETGGAPR
jgi:hypothetical protein